MAKKGIYAALGIAALLPLTGGVWVPCLTVALLPMAATLLYAPSLRVKAGWWLYFAAAALYLAAAVAVNGWGLWTAGGTAVLLSYVAPRIVHRKVSALWEVAVGAIATAVAVSATVCLFAAATGVSPADGIIAAYARGDDPLVWRLAERAYGGFTAETLGHAPYSSYDVLYRSDVLEAYAVFAVGRELSGNTLWYLTGSGVFAGGVVVVGGTAIQKVCRAEPDVPPVRSWRLGRSYLFAAVMPALLFALLSLYEPMRPVVRSVINVLVTLPAALCGSTLLYHTVCRARGGWRIALTALYWAASAVAALFYEWGIHVLGFLGIADMLLDVRKALDWALG